MTAFLSLANTVAGNAILGSIITKSFDSFVVSKVTQKNDKKKWLREKVLNLFTELSNEIVEIKCENLKVKQKNIKELIIKIRLLINNKSLQTTLENYIYILNEYECYKNEINLEIINEELINVLNKSIKKI